MSEALDRADPQATPEAVDWRASLERGAFEEALARLRALSTLGRGDPDVQDEVERVVAFREALRARDHGGAARLAAELDARPPVRVGVGTEGLAAAVAELAALDRSRSAPTPSALSSSLAHPLARAEAENTLGVHAVRGGHLAEARERFERALAADPRHYRAIANLGNLELEDGRLEAAVERYREAIRVNPEYGTGHHNLAAALRRQGKVSESVAALKRAQRLNLRDAPRRLLTGGAGSAPAAGRMPAWWSNRLVRWLVIVAVFYAVWRLLGR